MSSMEESLDTLSKTALRIADERNAFKAECQRLLQVVETQKNLLAVWMIANSFATGHGDSFEGLLNELTWQLRDRESKHREPAESDLERDRR